MGVLKGGEVVCGRFFLKRSEMRTSSPLRLGERVGIELGDVIGRVLQLDDEGNDVWLYRVWGCPIFRDPPGRLVKGMVY